jgi:hypothetical protein
MGRRQKVQLAARASDIGSCGGTLGFSRTMCFAIIAPLSIRHREKERKKEREIKRERERERERERKKEREREKEEGDKEWGMQG